MSLEFSPVSFGQHRGEYELWWYTRRRWRRDLGDDLTGDAVCHLVTDGGIQLRCPGEKLACQLGPVRAKARQLQ
jgi:hypothetical protein